MKYHDPPYWPTRFLRWFCSDSLIDAVEGDLYESFNRNFHDRGPRTARMIYFLQVLTFFRPFAFKKVSNTHKTTIHMDMIGHYFKLSIRKITSFSAFSIINLTGLSVGLAAALIIGLQVYDMLTFDHHHVDKDRIFLAYKERITPNGTQATFDTWTPLAEKLTDSYPSVQSASRYFSASAVIHHNEEYIREDIAYTDEPLFDIFTFDFVNGESTAQFPNVSSIVISKRTAQKYFNSVDVVGRELEMTLPIADTTARFTIAAIFEDLPLNSSIAGDIFLPIDVLPFVANDENGWNGSFLSTWVKVSAPEDSKSLESQFPDLVEEIWDQKTRENTHFRLLSLNDSYDEFFGDSSDAYLLLFIALGVLLIAGINYMNLVTAQYVDRQKEISVRRVLGANGGNISIQFYIESFLYAIISVVAGLLIAYLSIPWINEQLALALDFEGIISLQGAIFILLCLIGFALFSGSYPAFFLSRKRLVLRGSTSAQDAWIRHGLMVVQFVFAVMLINGAILVNSQLYYVTEKDMGFDQDQLLFVNISPRNFSDGEEANQKLEVFKNNLAKQSFVSDLSASRAVPTDWSGSYTFTRPQGWEGDPLRMRYTFVDEQFFDLYKIPFVNGRNFIADSQSDYEGGVILNEAAYKAFNFSDTAAVAINLGRNTYQVVGVVKDFHFETLRNGVEPTIHLYRPTHHGVHRYLSLRINGSEVQNAIATITAEWDQLGSFSPVNYQFADESVEQLYEAENQFLGMITLFTFGAMFIAAMGIFGMTIYLINRKKKELSIRKVIGANRTNILLLILKEYIWRIAIAAIIGSAGAIYFYQEWVSAFYYQLPVSPVTIMLSIMILFVIVIFTSGYHAMKAAGDNPVKYLRSE